MTLYWSKVEWHEEQGTTMRLQTFVGCIPYFCKTIFSMWIPVGGNPELTEISGLSAQQSSKRGRLLLQRLRRGANFCLPPDRNLTWNLMRTVKALEPPVKK